MEMNKAFKDKGKSLKGLFNRVDVDQSNEIELEEFMAMFHKMGLTQLTQVEVQHIFNSVDFDLSGNVTFPEFLSDFDHVVKTDIQVLLNEERDRQKSDSMNNASSGI